MTSPQLAFLSRDQADLVLAGSTCVGFVIHTASTQETHKNKK